MRQPKDLKNWTFFLTSNTVDLVAVVELFSSFFPEIEPDSPDIFASGQL